MQERETRGWTTGEQDYIRVEVPRLPEFVAVIRRAVEVVAVRARLPLEDLSDVSLALGEACSQAVAAAPYRGAGDILRLTCNRHAPDPARERPPAIHLRLEAPAVVFFQESTAPQAPPASASFPPVHDETALPVAGVSFSGSLISQLMKNVACYHTEQGTTVSFMRCFREHA